ncbi:DgyrCDS12175 [Dimorphilus gyrociliatus]|uniref:DgyrCDS12175 n=1 Tax=Dimorphilus gyrociliatus TaxID=2664684 RepID=A0A7I8W5S4_9ANNE|nr:DgyrCDS12175 [Dimorphilus gyrociliatus]
MTSECEGKIVQIPNNPASDETASTPHNAHVDILLDEHDDTGQSLQNDNFGSENIPSSLLNALFPLNEPSTTNLTQTEDDDPVSLSSNINQNSFNVNSPIKPELESPICNLSENSTHSEPINQTTVYAQAEPENTHTNLISEPSEDSTPKKGVNTHAFDDIQVEKSQDILVGEQCGDFNNSELKKGLNANVELEKAQENSVCEPLESFIHSEPKNSMSENENPASDNAKLEKSQESSVCKPSEDSTQSEPTNCMSAYVTSAIEHIEMEKSQENTTCELSEKSTHSPIENQTDVDSIRLPSQMEFDKTQNDLQEEKKNNAQEPNNFCITTDDNSEAIAHEVMSKEPEMSNEEIAVNKLLEVLDEASCEVPEADNKDVVDLRIDTGMSADYETHVENDKSAGNEYGQGISGNMMDILNSLDPVSSLKNDEEKENNLESAPSATISTAKEEEADDSDLLKSDKAKDSMRNRETTFEDREDKSVVESTNKKEEKLPVESTIQDNNLSITPTLDKQAVDSSVNSDDVDDEARIKLQELLHAQSTKIAEESDFDDIEIKAAPTVLITQDHSKEEKEESITDKTTDQQSPPCATVESKIRIEINDNAVEENEWNQVDTVEVAEQSTDDETEITSRLASPTITFKDAERECRKLNWLPYSEKVKTTVNKKGFFATVKSLFCGPPSLNKTLEEDRLFIFCMAAYQFDNNCETHIRVLQTIFKLLTGSRFDCPRYGNHWENIGFQGTDPSTDLRGTGFLGLLQILYLMTSHVDLGHKIYKLSLHETQNFPFCVMSINITRMCLQCLREGLINKESNIRMLVFPIFNKLYAGTFNEFYTMWKRGGKTIKDSGFVLKDLETNVRKQKDRILSQLDTSTKFGDNNDDDDKPLDFFNVCQKN